MDISCHLVFVACLATVLQVNELQTILMMFAVIAFLNTEQEESSNQQQNGIKDAHLFHCISTTEFVQFQHRCFRRRIPHRSSFVGVAPSEPANNLCNHVDCVEALPNLFQLHLFIWSSSSDKVRYRLENCFNGMREYWICPSVSYCCCS